MQKKFETKTVMVGEDDDLAKEARVLNPIVRWHSRKGITYETDPSVPLNLRSFTCCLFSSSVSRPVPVSQLIISACLGCKLADDDGDTLSSDEVTKHRRIKSELFGTTQDGRRIRHEESNKQVFGIAKHEDMSSVFIRQFIERLFLSCNRWTQRLLEHLRRKLIGGLNMVLASGAS